MIAQGNRLDSMETRMGSLSDKVTGTQLSVDNLMANRKALPTPVAAHPSEGAGTEPESAMAADDPEAGFVSDSAIQEYRKAAILLEARKYPEAVLAFSGFVEKYPDHPLAGSAQYSVGEAYFRQKEYKLAATEFERVLTSYDRSPHVSDTLRDLADAEDATKQPEKAARHRQLLTSLFPQSPAASAESAPAEAPHASRGQTGLSPAPTAGQPHLDEPPSSAQTTAHAALPTAPMNAPTSTTESREAK
jgi:tol-pal system protein YbgF